MAAEEMYYTVSITKDNHTWYLIVIEANDDIIFSGEVAFYDTDGVMHIAFASEQDKPYWWQKVPMPIRKEVMKRCPLLKYRRNETFAMLSSYIPKRDDPRERPVKNSPVSGDWRALVDCIPEHADPRQKKLF